MDETALYSFYGYFSVNITSIALRIALLKNTSIEIVDPNPIKLDYQNVNIFLCQLKSTETISFFQILSM